MGELLDLCAHPRFVAAPEPCDLATARRAAGMAQDSFRAALADELGWPSLPASAWRAFESGRVPPSPSVLAAAKRVVAKARRGKGADSDQLRRLEQLATVVRERQAQLNEHAAILRYLFRLPPPPDSEAAGQ